MATRKAGEPNRSAFLRDFLRANPKGSAREANDAWKAAGHPGEIGSSLFYQVKGARRGTKGKKRGRKPGSAAAVLTSSDSSPNDVSVTYGKMEAELDALIAQAESVKDGRLAGDLRAARRRASAKLI